MDRGRRGSVIGDPRRRARDLPAVPEKSMGGHGQMVEPINKFRGSMMAPDMPDDNQLVIDPNLLVGPLYVPQTTRTDRIKEQLGDITSKLHKTLYDFDEFDDFEQAEDPVVAMMRKKIGDLNDTDMRSKLTEFMDDYQGMSIQVNTANKDRDEMLLQLADWFTTDHVDLDDIKSSIDEAEEDNMKQSYFDTVTNFEKIKNLQSKILTASKQGKSTRQLEMTKLELEKDVVDHFKVMKDMSMQTMKLKVSDDAPWRYAANEIVDMLKNVRGENAEEMGLITKKMQGMIDQLEKQALTIKSLTAELRDKKEIAQKLTDENSDLSQDVAVLRARYIRYEKDLEAAKQLIRSLHKEKQVEQGKIQATVQSVQMGKSLSESISKVLSQFEEPDREVKEFSDDPAHLRIQLRDYQEALECIKSEYSRVTEEMEELTVELQEKKEYISNMENENEKLIKDIRRMRQEKRQSIAAGTIIPAAGDGHKCEHCKCHVPEKEIDEEIEELKKEVQKWQDRCTYFKKCLADTEMKLSDAYKEISALRMDMDVSSEPKVKDKQPETVDKSADGDAKKDNKKTEEKTDEVKVVVKSKPKQPKVRAKYLDKSQTSENKNKLPPIERTPLEREIEEQFPGFTSKQSRELKLYQAGDLQGKLNMLTCEIMDFVNEIGKMLHTDKDDQGNKIQSMKAFTFEESQAAASKKQKESRDLKEEEARQKKSQVIFSGQHACSKLREAFDTLSSSLNLQHNDYEAIYRSFKVSQQRNSIRREVLMGRMPANALNEFDRIQRKKMQESGPDNLMQIYFNISYGGGGGGMQTKKFKPRDDLQRRSSSTYSFQSDSAEESEMKLKNTMHVLSIQRSKSDLDVHDTSMTSEGMGMFGGGLFRERSQLYLGNVSDINRRESIPHGNKQEVKMGVAVVPRKGLISLSTMDDSVQKELGVQGEKRRTSTTEGHSAKTKSLIKRKDIIEQIRMGTKLLEDAEAEKHKEEEMTKSLGDYTIMDLQSKILEMTDTKSIKRQPPNPLEMSSSSKRQTASTPKPDKGITLPAIKNLNPFAMKSM